MPSRFLLQPNGKLAQFSTIVDNFTYYNMTEEEAFEVAFEEMGREAAKAKVVRGVSRGLDAHGGWNECLETVRVIHGEKARNEVEAEILLSEPQQKQEQIVSRCRYCDSRLLYVFDDPKPGTPQETCPHDWSNSVDGETCRDCGLGRTRLSEPDLCASEIACAVAAQWSLASSGDVSGVPADLIEALERLEIATRSSPLRK